MYYTILTCLKCFFFDIIKFNFNHREYKLYRVNVAVSAVVGRNTALLKCRYLRL